MIQETLSQVKKKIESAQSIQEENKKEIMNLLSRLQVEIDALARTNPEHAESIAGFAQSSAHEATRADKSPELYKLSMDGLAASVRGFEVSHPKLVEIVNSISVALSNLGI
jgi:hypothetical protein